MSYIVQTHFSSYQSMLLCIVCHVSGIQNVSCNKVFITCLMSSYTVYQRIANTFNTDTIITHIFQCFIFIIYFVKTNYHTIKLKHPSHVMTTVFHVYVYSKYVFMSLTDSPLYLVLYTFGTYLYFVFVYRNVFCFVFAVSIHQPKQPGVLIITICLYFLTSHVMCWAY